ncbi:MAG: cysteine-rich VLP domain-containing protein [Oscillospiraceae bacterium]|nr:cysteine-rich VLP domain-containing protein [Oscillospiraceae bacterium]
MFNIKNLSPIERRPDGSLPRMTPRQRQEAVRLIRKICCNYLDGDCLLLDGGEGCVCVQSISYSVNCKFFRRVLLEDKKGLSLKAELFRDNDTKRCMVCGGMFSSKSNSAKYCGDCAKIVQRKQKVAHARNRRRSIVEK